MLIDPSTSHKDSTLSTLFIPNFCQTPSLPSGWHLLFLPYSIPSLHSANLIDLETTVGLMHKIQLVLGK